MDQDKPRAAVIYLLRTLSRLYGSPDVLGSEAKLREVMRPADEKFIEAFVGLVQQSEERSTLKELEAIFVGAQPKVAALVTEAKEDARRKGWAAARSDLRKNIRFCLSDAVYLDGRFETLDVLLDDILSESAMEKLLFFPNPGSRPQVELSDCELSDATLKRFNGPQGVAGHIIARLLGINTWDYVRKKYRVASYRGPDMMPKKDSNVPPLAWLEKWMDEWRNP